MIGGVSLGCGAARARAQHSDDAGVLFRSDVIGCGNGAGFQQRVAQMLGSGPDRYDAHASPHVEVLIGQPTPAVLQGTLTVSQNSNAPVVRQIRASSDDCAELLETLALQVAIAIDPMVALRDTSVVAAEAAPVENVAVASVTAVEAQSVSVEVTRWEPSRDDAARWNLRRGGIGVGALVGVVPGIGAFAELRGAIGSSRWSVHSVVRVSLPSEERFGGGSVAVALAGLELALCHDRAFGSICAGAEFAAVWGSGRGYADPSTEVVPMLLPSISYARAFRISDGLSLVPRLGVSVALWRATFEVDGVAAFRTTPVTASLSVAAIFGGE
jgi:hypothetical protein